MKKKRLNILNLNKKSISAFKPRVFSVKGGYSGKNSCDGQISCECNTNTHCATLQQDCVPPTSPGPHPYPYTIAGEGTGVPTRCESWGQS